MKILQSHIDVSTFWERLRKSESSLLCLDYDGTLAPFRRERDQAVPYPGVRERLKRLIESRKTRTVIISGRWTEDLLPLLGLETTPEIWGCHGAERRSPDGLVTITELAPEAKEELEALEEWATGENLIETVERKPISLAFHWRNLSDDLIEHLQAGLSSRLEQFPPTALERHDFDGGIELKVRGTNKGHAVVTLLEECGHNLPIAYLGDDATDEDAFRALEGHGLRILVRKELRPTDADLWLTPPEELLSFLDTWLDAVA